jgi:hypothetical protein
LADATQQISSEEDDGTTADEEEVNKKLY